MLAQYSLLSIDEMISLIRWMRAKLVECWDLKSYWCENKVKNRAKLSKLSVCQIKITNKKNLHQPVLKTGILKIRSLLQSISKYLSTIQESCITPASQGKRFVSEAAIRLWNILT